MSDQLQIIVLYANEDSVPKRYTCAATEDVQDLLDRVFAALPPDLRNEGVITHRSFLFYLYRSLLTFFCLKLIFRCWKFYVMQNRPHPITWPRTT
jgi:hypothetical protein